VTLWAEHGRNSIAQAWSQALGGAAVLLVRSADRARALLLEAAEVAPGEPVGVPANGDRDLVESIKRHGARPRFLDLGQDLAPQGAAPRITWAQPVGGLGALGAATWADHADTLPRPGRQGTLPRVALYGLHLSGDPRTAGAILIFGDPALHAATAARIGPDDAPEPSRALAQLRRLCGDHATLGLAERQHAALEEAARGITDAAGLELLPADATGALPHQIAVRIPAESDPATFYAYVKAEQTPVRWLPEVRPLHYAAVREPGRSAATAAEIARWLLVPVGPDYTDEEIKHAVLGIVKAAEYLGVRWRCDPAHAAEYAAMLDALYGPGHDAYRPVFPTAGA
jgi:hypothetical protein